MTHKLLLVDDDRKLVETLSRALTEEGFQVQTAFNGIEAMQWLKKEQFDLVILDLEMPQMDGSKVLRLLRADPKLHEQKVLVCSSTQDWDRGTESLMIRAKSAAWFPEKSGWDGRYTEVYKYNADDPLKPGAFSTDIIAQIRQMLGNG